MSKLQDKVDNIVLTLIPTNVFMGFVLYNTYNYTFNVYILLMVILCLLALTIQTYDLLRYVRE